MRGSVPSVKWGRPTFFAFLLLTIVGASHKSHPMTDAKSEIKALVKRAEAYSKSSGLAFSTVSRLIFNDGKRLGELKAGKSKKIWAETLDAANAKLAAMESEITQAKAS